MTEAEKKMKKYTSAIERRLNLPRKVKARVMSDFISSIEARRETGMTEEQIYEELGTPAKAAADLNEQMKEYAYRKSPWRFLFLAAAIFGGVEVLSCLAAWILYLSMGDPLFTGVNAASIGIIGGSDGPTAIFVTTAVPQWTEVLIPVLLLILGICGFLRLRKCRTRE